MSRRGGCQRDASAASVPLGIGLLSHPKRKENQPCSLGDGQQRHQPGRVARAVVELPEDRSENRRVQDRIVVGHAERHRERIAHRKSDESGNEQEAAASLEHACVGGDLRVFADPDAHASSSWSREPELGSCVDETRWRLSIARWGRVPGRRRRWDLVVGRRRGLAIRIGDGWRSGWRDDGRIDGGGVAFLRRGAEPSTRFLGRGGACEKGEKHDADEAPFHGTQSSGLACEGASAGT